MTRLFCRRASLRSALAGMLAATAVAAFVSPHADAAGHDFLWKISGRQGAVYLAGSIHVMPESFYPLAVPFDTAFKDSDLLVEEIDLGEANSATAGFALISHSMLPADQSLETVLAPATYADVKKHVADLGVPIESLKRLKPWMLAVTFEALEWQKAGYDQSFGLDQHFYELAQSGGKAVQGFETAEFQLSMFDGMPMDQQDHMLADTLKELDTEVGAVGRIGDAWKSGDAAGLERIILPDLKQDPAMYRKIIVDRNQAWLPRIDALLARRGRAFIVVGAGHLVGPDGLLAQLKAKGYNVEQL